MNKRNIIIGTDWWTDCDDVAAVRVACRLAKREIWNISGVILNACMEYSAASLDGFLRFEGFNLPIGIDCKANDFGHKPPYQKRITELCNARGIVKIRLNSECEDGVQLYRRLLSEAEDSSVEIIEIGYMQVIAALLESGEDDISPYTGIELIKRKVKRLWIMGGNWESEEGGRENNFIRNRRTSIGANKLLKLYPGEIVFLGYEVGASVITHPNPVEGDLLYEAFKAHGSANGRSSWDPMLVLLAAGCPDASDDEFEASGYRTVRGTATVDEDGCNHFVRSDDGRHRYVVKLKPDEWYSAAIDDMIK
ncbi:MAG: hypothetical protein HFE63_05645 [Clostridiales bacterium]|nr:hypothetical protein [Clostridiales bacterium]